MPERVLRHPLSVRLVHWALALSGLVLVFSGFGQMPMYKRYNVVDIPGFSWASNYEITLLMHYYAAIVFMLAALFHLVYHLRRGERAAWPKRGDMSESIQIIKAMMAGKAEPPHEKFLAEQRLAYAAIFVVSAILIVTGLIKTYVNMGPIVINPTFLLIVTYTHTFATMAFIFLFIAHLAAFLIKANRPLLPSMISGYVPQAYARERHPLWQVPDTQQGKNRSRS